MNIAIAAGHEATADTALEILQAGGNAFDAAIGALFTAFIAEPCMASAGGGAFAQVFQASGKAMLFDFFCQTPIFRRSSEELDFYPIEVDFGDAKEIFHIGRGSVAVPGSIAGLYAMHAHLASMPMYELVQPAIQLAKEGVVMNNFQHLDLSLLEEILRVDTQASSVFFPKGHLLKVGEHLHMPQLADFLDSLAKEGPDFFYRGEIAQKIVADHQQTGGLLTMDDFSNYEVLIRQPLQLKYQDWHVFTNPLPSTGGAILVLLLQAMQHQTMQAHPTSAAHIRQLHPILEAVDTMGKQPEALLNALLNNNISSAKIEGIYPERLGKWGSTSHFNITDAYGNAVSLSTTIGEGSGCFIEGTDMQLNNMLGEAALLPNGFHSWPQNQRLSSMMAPTIVLDQFYRPKIVTGSGGASRIPAAIFQVINNLLNYQLPVEEAVSSPRLHLEHELFNIEYGFEQEVGLETIHQQVVRWKNPSMFFGGVHTIYRDGDTYQAAGDPRRDGVALLKS